MRMVKKEGVYADHLSEEEWQALFGESDDKEFYGSQKAASLLNT